MKATETEKRDWSVIALILLFGLLGILLAGGWALRFTPGWELDANVESRLDPNSDFLTRKPEGFIEPVDPAILTNPAWIDAFLTPGASFPSAGTSLPALAGTSFTTQTPGTPVTTQTPHLTTTGAATNTALVSPSPTNTFVYFPPLPSSTPKPRPPSTSTSVIASPTPTASATPTQTSTGAATFTATASVTPSQTLTPTATSTATDTPIASTPTSPATPTATNTTDPTEPDFGGPDGNTILLGNGAWIEFNLSGFLLDGDPAWDVVYYETEESSAAGKVHLGAVLIEVYDETTAAWYTIYYWGDGNADANASYSNNPEPDGFPVDMGLLYGAPPWNTGIAIDIDSVAIGQGGAIGDSITKIRITSLSSNDCNIDSLQMLR